jgi:hypothetical protein
MIWSVVQEAWRRVTAQRDPLAENRTHAVERARRITKVPSFYILGAGGRSPTADTPFTVRDGRTGSDCVGFTCWCLSHDRYQPKTFTTYGGWINTDSLMMDAHGPCEWYAPQPKPEPGDVVVFPSLHHDGKMTRMGHIALVVDVPADMPDDVYALPAAERRQWLTRVRVIDCAAAHGRVPHAVSETTAAASWDKPDAMFARCLRVP